MTAVITFKWPKWVALFPEFSNCSVQQGQAWFDLASSYCWNDTCNPAACAPNFESLMYMVTSHIGWLMAPRDSLGNPSEAGTPPPPIVGRISNASEGSVSVTAEWTGQGSPSEAWYLQTRYGAMYWAATAQYRTMRYAPQPTVVAGSIRPYVPSALGPWFRGGGR